MRVFLLGVVSALLVLVSSAASAMPVGAVFYSSFSDYDTQWYSRLTAPDPSVIQLAGSSRVEVATGESYGHFHSLERVPLAGLVLDDLEILLRLDGASTTGVSLRVGWFQGDLHLGSERVFRIEQGDLIGTDSDYVRRFTELTIPAGTDRFDFSGFVWGDGGFGLFDELLLAPDAARVIPEPSTALLMGLGLTALAMRREREER